MHARYWVHSGCSYVICPAAVGPLLARPTTTFSCRPHTRPFATMLTVLRAGIWLALHIQHLGASLEVVCAILLLLFQVQHPLRIIPPSSHIPLATSTPDTASTCTVL